jgi:hypothetical protein
VFVKSDAALPLPHNVNRHPREGEDPSHRRSIASDRNSANVEWVTACAVMTVSWLVAVEYDLGRSMSAIGEAAMSD